MGGSDSAGLARRTFLKPAGAAALGLPTTACTRVGPPPTKRSESVMEIKRAGSQPSAKGPAEWFTGAVRIDPLFPTHPPARSAGASVTFEPGARTAWHTHPLGQTLIVVSGYGRVQRWGGPVEEIRLGDVVWFPPGEKHWHGATTHTHMAHIAVNRAGSNEIFEPVEKIQTPGA